MKKIFFLLLVNMITVATTAQFKLTLVLSATPPARLTEWANKREVLTLLVTGQVSGGSAEAKIKTEIKTADGTVIGTTDLARARSITFANGNTILTATEVLPLENMIFTGRYKNTLDKTGKLPADNYTLCMQLVRPVDYVPLSEQECKSFYVAGMQLPILLKPYNGEVLEPKIAQTAIIFRWTPLVPRQSTVATYRIQVFEVLQNQQPVQALRSNQPLLDKEIRGATQYIWQPQLGLDIFPATDSTNISARKGFVWTIQTLDDNGLPVQQTDGNGESRSEPAFFTLSTPAHKKN